MPSATTCKKWCWVARESGWSSMHLRAASNRRFPRSHCRLGSWVAIPPRELFVPPIPRTSPTNFQAKHERRVKICWQGAPYSRDSKMYTHGTGHDAKHTDATMDV